MVSSTQIHPPTPRDRSLAAVAGGFPISGRAIAFGLAALALWFLLTLSLLPGTARASEGDTVQKQEAERDAAPQIDHSLLDAVSVIHGDFGGLLRGAIFVSSRQPFGPFGWVEVGVNSQLRGTAPSLFIELDSKELEPDKWATGFAYTIRLSKMPVVDPGVIVRAQVISDNYDKVLPVYDYEFDRTAENWDKRQDIDLAIISPPIGESAVYLLTHVVETQPANYDGGTIPITRIGNPQQIKISVKNTKLLFDAPDATATYTMDLDEFAPNVDLPRVVYEDSGREIRYSLSGDLPSGFLFVSTRDDQDVGGPVDAVLGSASFPLTLIAEDETGDRATKPIELRFVNPWQFLRTNARTSGAAETTALKTSTIEPAFTMTTGQYGEIVLPPVYNLFTGKRVSPLLFEATVYDSRVASRITTNYQARVHTTSSPLPGLTLAGTGDLIITGTPTGRTGGDFVAAYIGEENVAVYRFRINVAAQ